MRLFDAILTKTKFATVQVEAESAEEAEEILLDRFLHCEIELEYSDIPGDINILVTEAGFKSPTDSDKISIYWNDLTTEKQAEILATFGDNRNYDVFPIAEISTIQEDTE